MDPTQISVGEIYLMHQRIRTYSAEPIEVGLIFLVTLVTGWLGQFFWPQEKWRPLSSSLAWFGAVQAAMFSGLSLYISYQVLIAGQIRCLVKARRCPRSMFVDERWISVVVHPFSFWMTYFYIFLISVILIAWFFVCVQSIKACRVR